MLDDIIVSSKHQVTLQMSNHRLKAFRLAMIYAIESVDSKEHKEKKLSRLDQEAREFSKEIVDTIDKDTNIRS